MATSNNVVDFLCHFFNPYLTHIWALADYNALQLLLSKK